MGARRWMVVRRGRTEQCEKGTGAWREGAAWEGANHAGEKPKHTFHAREAAGKIEHLAATLRRAGSSGGVVRGGVVPGAGTSG
jgi:hypothetical protein